MGRKKQSEQQAAAEAEDAIVVTIPRVLRPLSRIASGDTQRPALCGVHVRCADWVLEVAATDGTLAMYATVTADDAVELPEGVTIKTEDFKAGLAHVARKSKERINFPTVDLRLERDAEAEIVNRGPETTIRVDSRKVEGLFPDMGVVIPHYTPEPGTGPSGWCIEKTINASKLAKLLMTIAAMTDGAVTIQMPLGTERTVVCRADLEDGIGQVVGVMVADREIE